MSTYFEKITTHTLTVRGGGSTLTVSLTVKIPLFFLTTPLRHLQKIKFHMNQSVHQAPYVISHMAFEWQTMVPGRRPCLL